MLDFHQLSVVRAGRLLLDLTKPLTRQTVAIGRYSMSKNAKSSYLQPLQRSPLHTLRSMTFHSYVRHYVIGGARLAVPDCGI